MTIVVCYVTIVVCRMTNFVCFTTIVVCCRKIIVCCMAIVVCYMTIIVCFMRILVCCISIVVCCMPIVVCCNQPPMTTQTIRCLIGYFDFSFPCQELDILQTQSAHLLPPQTADIHYISKGGILTHDDVTRPHSNSRWSKGVSLTFS